MGRLRHDEDVHFITKVAEEVVDLFGTNIILYKFDAADNETTRDPLYDEPASPHTVRYKDFVLKAHFFDYNDTPFVTDGGMYSETTATGYICLSHLIASGVPQDNDGNFLNEGDVIQFHTRAGKRIYDIIQTTRVGWVNTSDKYTGYTFSLKRSSKYIPERKEDVNL